MAALPDGSVGKTVIPSTEMIEVLVDGSRYGDMEDVQSALQHSVGVNSTDTMGRTGGQQCYLSACSSHAWPEMI